MTGEGAQTGRLGWLDGWRGFAVLAMVVYHFCWNLSHFGLIAIDVGVHPAGVWSARLIAGSFLLIAGLGLALAHGGGVRWEAFLRRLGVVGAAALAVTGATMAVFPENFVAFGILHCIALGSLLCLPFLRAPALVSLAGAAAIAAATAAVRDPRFEAWGQAHAGGWDFRIIQHLGLSRLAPDAVDFVPLFPWLAVMLVGVAIGRGVRAGGALPAVGGGSRLGWLGRHSLVIYLAHQPLLFGAVFLAAQAFGPADGDVRAVEFERGCNATCLATTRGDGGAGACARGCACIVSRIAADPPLRQVLFIERRETQSSQEALRTIVQGCLRP